MGVFKIGSKYLVGKKIKGKWNFPRVLEYCLLQLYNVVFCLEEVKKNIIL